MKKYLLAFLVTFVILVSPAFASDMTEGSPETSSDLHYLFSVRGGANIPLYAWFPESDTENERIGSATGLKIGYSASLAFHWFASSRFIAGVEAGFSSLKMSDDSSFASDKGNTQAMIIPLALKLTWLPVQGTITVPLSLGLGGSILRLDNEEMGHFTFYASLETGVTWFFSENWGIGLTAGIWAVPEIFTGETDRKYTGVLFGAPVSLSLTCRY